MGLADWLQQKAAATGLEACELALSRFCAAADADPAYRLQVAEAVWTLLLSTAPVGEDPAACLAEIRAKAAGLDPDTAGLLTRKLLEESSAESAADGEAGKLVACWFKAIALQGSAGAEPDRARHVVRSYERAFIAMARLMDRAAEPPGEG